MTPFAKTRRSPLFRIVGRELRGGLRGFGIFLACIALGVGAIVGVASLSRSFTDGLAREGRRILGGDVSFALVHRQLNSAERSFLSRRGAISPIAVLRAMARNREGASTLVEVKAVDRSWPSQGAAVFKPSIPLTRLLAFHDGAYGLAAAPELAARLDLKIGDSVKIGASAFQLRATLLSEPDTLATGIGLGPRVLMSQDALRATGLLQPGSLVRWIYRVTLPGSQVHPVTQAQVSSFEHEALAAFPKAGWEVRTRSNISPELSTSLRQLTQFLTLVGLTALIVGGVGVANAVRSFVERKSADFATFKSLGATGGQVFAIALMQALSMTALGVAIGLLLGALTPYLVAWGFGRLIPLPFAPSLYPKELAIGALYGLLTALAFSSGPLGRSHDVPVAALFRDRVAGAHAPPRLRYVLIAAGAGAVLMVSIVYFAADRRIAWVYLFALLGGFVVLRGVAWLLTLVARRAPHVRGAELRLALANIHRPGAPTPSIVLSLGLGLALLTTLAFIDGNLRREIGASAPGKTPSLFFLDVPSAQAISFQAFVRDRAPGVLVKEAPLLRGRVVALNGRSVDKIKPSEDVAWVLQGDRGLTYSSRLPAGSKLVSGKWWPANYKGPPLVSMDAKIATALGLKPADSVTINVLGRNVTARIANLRSVDWRSLGINFIFVFSPNALEGAPHSVLASATFPKGSPPSSALALLRSTARSWPAVTTISVKSALEVVNDLLDRVALAVRTASAIALAASILVLAGAMASSQQNRIYDAVVLKTLGATRLRLLYALVLEYAFLGLATAVFGVFAGAVAAWAILTKIMKADIFIWLWSSAAEVVVSGLLITISLGLVGTFRVLGQKPAPHLREL